MTLFNVSLLPVYYTRGASSNHTILLFCHKPLLVGTAALARHPFSFSARVLPVVLYTERSTLQHCLSRTVGDMTKGTTPLVRFSKLDYRSTKRMPQSNDVFSEGPSALHEGVPTLSCSEPSSLYCTRAWNITPGLQPVAFQSARFSTPFTFLDSQCHSPLCIIFPLSFKYPLCSPPLSSRCDSYDTVGWSVSSRISTLTVHLNANEAPFPLHGTL